MQGKTLHIGNSILEKLKTEDLSMAWLARKVGCDRSNFRKKLLNNTIEIDLLFRISEVLHEDFFAQCSTAFCGKKTTYNK